VRRFYRIARNSPPTRDDFLSHVAQAKVLRRDDPESRRLAEGLSVWATEAQARRQARGLPWLGRYIAALDVPEDGPIKFEKTRGAGHYTLWCAPGEALNCVVDTLPV
jgi:hypothetical protein